jgi:hypothetical protein
MVDAVADKLGVQNTARDMSSKQAFQLPHISQTSDAPSDEDSPNALGIHGLRLQARNNSRDRQRNSLNKLHRSHNASVEALLDDEMRNDAKRTAVNFL